MADITVSKDTIWRYAGDEYACLSLQRITQLTDGDTVYEKVWRRIITPDDDLAVLEATLGVPTAVADIIRTIATAGRYASAVALYDARKAEQEA